MIYLLQRETKRGAFHRAFVAHSRSFSFVHSSVRSFVRNWKRRKKQRFPRTRAHRSIEEERGSFKFFRKMNAPSSSRRVKLQKFRTLCSPHDERGSDLFIYTTKKPVAYKRTPSLPTRTTRLFSPPCPYYFFFSILFPLVPMHLHARAIQPSPIWNFKG